MPKFHLNPEDLAEDSEASIDDDARSTASTTLSQRELELDEENRRLKQAALTAQNDMARLKAQLEALQLATTQAAARERAAEERAKRQAEEQVLAERATAAQRIEAATRQMEEEKRARENAENQARATQVRLFEFERAEAAKKAAEEAARQAEIEAKRQAEEAAKIKREDEWVKYIKYVDMVNSVARDMRANGISVQARDGGQLNIPLNAKIEDIALLLMGNTLNERVLTRLLFK